MNCYIAMLSGALIGLVITSPSHSACRTLLTERNAVALQTQMLDALSREDRTAFRRLTTDDLVLNERGKVYDRDGLFAIASDAHRAGTRIVWRVTNPQVTSDCRLAVMSYINSGSVQTRGQDAVPVRWLETAAYRRDVDGWRVFLLTSERSAEMKTIVAPAPPAGVPAPPGR